MEVNRVYYDRNINNMRVLIACEYSGTVRDAFLAKGHDALSCDILPTESLGPHYQGDVMDIINDGWDIMIAHPPCTYFSRAVMHYLKNNNSRQEKLLESFEFVKRLYNAPIKRICIENPPGWMSTNWKKPTQIIHPWYFGCNEMKQTGLWLKGLKRLNGKIEVAIDRIKYKPKPTSSKIGSDGKMRNAYFMDRVRDSKERAKFWPGIAKAMANQWSDL